MPRSFQVNAGTIMSTYFPLLFMSPYIIIPSSHLRLSNICSRYNFINHAIKTIRKSFLWEFAVCMKHLSYVWLCLFKFTAVHLTCIYGGFIQNPGWLCWLLLLIVSLAAKHCSNMHFKITHSCFVPCHTHFTICNISFHTNASADKYLTYHLFTVHSDKLFFYCLTMQIACLHLTSLSTTKDKCLLSITDTQHFMKFKKRLGWHEVWIPLKSITSIGNKIKLT
jgi:hypothetical protein